jgi:hypothetical protein
VATRSSAYLSGRRTCPAERPAVCASLASAMWLLQTGRTHYRATYRAETEGEIAAQAWLRLQLAGLQCWSKWARSFT